jgi:ethanolamine-phosphate cytidylyltransferase
MSIPKNGHWPVDPQEPQPISEDRIWIDGCFDFAHHGHAGASLQARRLGKELLVGVHSDEAIMDNKGPTVMNLKERIAAVEACRWVTKAVPHAPYVTSVPWIDHYGCQYVGHGDDITSDGSGEDCYRFVKQANRFKVFKRTPGISTTDLVGRMLLCTRSHFIKSLTAVLAGKEGSGDEVERKDRGEEMLQRIRDYATDSTGSEPHCEVWGWLASKQLPLQRTISHVSGRHTDRDDAGKFDKMVAGVGPRDGQRVVYVDGGFDLFSSGHIEFLRKVIELENVEGKKQGWFTDDSKKKRIQETGEDYGPAYVLAGIHDDEVINHYKGVNYPIMNIFERGLCVLQCKVCLLSPCSLTSPLTMRKVHQRRHLWRTLQRYTCIS